jgi:uncharacterized protein YqcC (DUF446 family)
MHDIHNRIADVLLEVEATLRVTDKWDRNVPGNDALASQEPFCMDTLKFEQWLQWIFLPRMKDTLEQARPLPRESGIFNYAEDCLHKNDPCRTKILALIKHFDELISIQSGVKRH